MVSLVFSIRIPKCEYILTLIKNTYRLCTKIKLRLALVALQVPEVDDIEHGDDAEFLLYHDYVSTLYMNSPEAFMIPPPDSAEIYISDGAIARGRGVTRTCVDYVYEPFLLAGEKHEVQLLPPFHPRKWRLYDGTLPTSTYENRYRSLASWSQNSCALDAILFAGIYSRAAVQQIDGITIDSWRRLSASQKTFREVLRLPWGSLSQNEKDAARDRWRTVSQTEYKGKSNGTDLKRCVNQLMVECFGGLPSFSFTAIQARVSCCGSFRPKKLRNVTERRCNVLEVLLRNYQTIPEVIQGVFWTEDAKGSPNSCNSSCKRGSFKTKVVLDRLPPMLAILIGGGVEILKHKQTRPYDDLELQYRTIKSWKKTKFTLDGIIFCVGSNQDHFIGRWQGHEDLIGQIVHYDSYHNGPEVVRVASWDEGLRPEDRIRVLVYRQI